MIARRLLLCAVVLAVHTGIAGSARAEHVVASLSSDRVLIHSSFAGAELVLFGAVSEDKPARLPPRAYDIVVTVTGPRLNMVTVRKERVLGLWVNVASRPFTGTPAYLAVLANRPLARVASAERLRPPRVDLAGSWASQCDADPMQTGESHPFVGPTAAARRRLVRVANASPRHWPEAALAATNAPECPADRTPRDNARAGGFYPGPDAPGVSEYDSNAASADPFRAALVRLNTEHGLYREATNGVTFVAPRVFRATIELPANVPVGHYAVDVKLFAEAAILDAQQLSFDIAKVGFQQYAASFARDHGLLNGFATAGLALLTGWFASIAFRRD